MAANLTTAAKARIIRKRFIERKALHSIAREEHCTKLTVIRVLRRFNDSEDLSRQEVPGRPQALQPRHRSALNRLIKKKRSATSGALTAELRRMTGVRERPHHSR